MNDKVLRLIKIAVVMTVILMAASLVQLFGDRDHTQLAEAQTSGGQPLVQQPILVVRYDAAGYPSVWKFDDAGRLCYFTGDGGIWCTDNQGG